MTWDEIQGRNWTMPAARRKTEVGHGIALTDTALELLAQARGEAQRLNERRNWPESKIVFEHRQGQAATPRGLARALVRYAEDLGNKPTPDWGHWTAHDLRRSCRTRLAEIGVGQEVAERVIGHAPKGMVGVYDQHRYQDEIRMALEGWERRLLGIVNPPTDNVLPFQASAA